MQRLNGWVEAGNTAVVISGTGQLSTAQFQGSFPLATVTVYVDTPLPIAITSIARSSNVVTVGVQSGGFIAGQQVAIANVTDSSYNGTFMIVSTGALSLTYAQTGANSSSSGGTAYSALILASIYADNSSTVKANPFTAGSDGTWYFYAGNGIYDVKFSGAGIPAPFTVSGMTAFEPYGAPTYAADFPGGDLGAKITAASNYLTALAGDSGTAPGEIWVTGYDAGDTISTNAIWGYAQTVRFVGGGVYTLNAYMSGGYLIGLANGSDIAPVQFVQGNGANLPYLWKGAAVKGTVRDCTFIGNSANNPSALDNMYSPYRQLFVRVKSIDATRHGFYSVAFSLDAGGGHTFDNCSFYSNGGSGVRVEGCVDLCTRGYTEVGGNGMHGIDLYNSPGARLIGGDFASNQLAALNISGTTIAAGGLEASLITVQGNQFGQNYQQDIVINGYDTVNAGQVGFDITINGNVFWAGGLRNSDWPSIDLIDCQDIVVADNVFDSTEGGSEYRNAIRETSPNNAAGPNIIGPNACTPPFAGLTYDLLPNLSIVHAGTGTNQGVSKYTELDVANLGVRGGEVYLGGNYLTSNVTQFINDSVLTAGGVTGNLFIAAYAGVAVAFAVDVNGNFGIVGTFGIAGAPTSDPSIPGRVWSDSGILQISGSAYTPSFAGAAATSGVYVGGVYSASGVTVLLDALGFTVSGVVGERLTIGHSGIGLLSTQDNAGNLGITGTLGLTPPTSDPSIAGLLFNLGGSGLCVLSGTTLASLKSYLGITSGGFPSVSQTVILTTQSAVISSTNFTPTTAPGIYQVNYTLSCTTADAGGGTIQLEIVYTDVSLAVGNNQKSTALVLTSLGSTQGCLSVELASGNIAYLTILSGGFAASQYALIMTLMRLS